MKAVPFSMKDIWKGHLSVKNGIYSTLNFYGLSNSSRKPIVNKPPASI